MSLSSASRRRKAKALEDSSTPLLCRAGIEPMLDPVGHLDRFRNFYEGDVIRGLVVCLAAGIAVPEWLAVAFVSRARSALGGDVRSWDEAFAPPFPKRTNLAAFRRSERNRPRVLAVVVKLVALNPTRTVDKGFWEEVGSVVGEGATRAEELYRAALRAGEAQSIQEMRRASLSKCQPTGNGTHAG